MNLDDIEKENKKDPVDLVVLVRHSGKKVDIPVAVYHAILDRIFEEAVNAS